MSMASTVRRALVVLGLLLAALAWAGPMAAADGTRAGVTVLPVPSGSAPPATPGTGAGGSTPSPQGSNGSVGAVGTASPPGSNGSSGSGGAGSLPNTGVNLAVELGSALALLAGGAVLIVAGRRRRGGRAGDRIS
jgi:hypothetical protein